jgi:hypothetical protein
VSPESVTLCAVARPGNPVVPPYAAVNPCSMLDEAGSSVVHVTTAPQHPAGAALGPEMIIGAAAAGVVNV